MPTTAAPGATAAAPRLASAAPTWTPYVAETRLAASPALTVTPTRAARTPAPTAARTLTPAEGQPLSIGQSVNGRPLEVYRFGSGPARRMIVADIHGGYEANTAALAKLLIDYLREHPNLVPAEQTLYILPSLNPDGYALGSRPEGRPNANGVDLNRNWDASWQADWQKAGCWDTLPISAGDGPGSEPETRALAQFLKDHPVEALISYHSAGAVIYAGGVPPDAASNKLAVLLSRVSGYSYPPGSICAYTGQMIDWASANGIAAVDVELTNHAETDFAINLRVLKAFLAWKK